MAWPLQHASATLIDWLWAASTRGFILANAASRFEWPAARPNKSSLKSPNELHMNWTTHWGLASADRHLRDALCRYELRHPLLRQRHCGVYRLLAQRLHGRGGDECADRHRRPGARQADAVGPRPG